MNYDQFNNALPKASPKYLILRYTYLLLALSFVPTAIGALVQLQVQSVGLTLVALIAFFVCSLIASYSIRKNKVSFSGVIWMMVIAFLMGVLIGGVVGNFLKVPNGGSLVAMAASATAAIFVGMSILAFVIRRDLSFLQNFITVGLIGALVIALFTFFFHLTILYALYSGIIIIACSLSILWQLNNILIAGETNFIAAALVLYLDIMNIFLAILNLLSIFGGGDRR